MQLQEIQDNIKSRRNKIFLLMEEVKYIKSTHIFLLTYFLFVKAEISPFKYAFLHDFFQVRRLRVQQRLKSSKVFDENGNEENEMPEIPSTIPFLSHVVILKAIFQTSLGFSLDKNSMNIQPTAHSMHAWCAIKLTQKDGIQARVDPIGFKWDHLAPLNVLKFLLLKLCYYPKQLI